jgi:hypothetical protein
VLPFQIGAMYREWAGQGHALLAVATLDNVLKTSRRLEVNTHPLVEITHRRDPKGRFEWVALFNHSGHLENAIHPPIPINNVEIRLATDRRVKRVVSLTSGEELRPAMQETGELSAVLPRLNVFEIVLFEFEG